MAVRVWQKSGQNTQRMVDAGDGWRVTDMGTLEVTGPNESGQPQRKTLAVFHRDVWASAEHVVPEHRAAKLPSGD